METMSTLTIKQFPEKLRHRLKERAKEHRRSLNREAIVCFEEVLDPRPLNPREFLNRVRTARRKLATVYIREKDLQEAKRAGRL